MDVFFTLNDIRTVAQEFLSHLNGRGIIAFHGQMGTGKTTFIHALCDEMKVKGTVSSPTYSIINEYESAAHGKIYHIDLYRLNDQEEAVQAGVEDCLYSGNVCLVEWPERAPGLFPDETLHVWLEITGEKTRRIRIADY